MIAAMVLMALTGAFTLLMAFYSAQAEKSGPQATWSRVFDNGYYDYGSSVRQTGDGGFVIAGGTSPCFKGDRDALLARTDENGSLLWQRSYGGTSFDYGYAVIETSDGGYAMAGITESSGNGSGDVYLVRTDANGELLWEKTFGGSGYDEGRALLQASDGGFVVAGAIMTPGNGSEIYLIKTNLAGDLEWEKTFGGPYDDLAISVGRTHDGGYILGGYYGTGKNHGEGYLLKVDAGGNFVWDKRLAGEDSIVYQVRQTGDGGYAAVGHTHFLTGDSEIHLTRTDHLGNLQWQKVFRGNGTLKGYDLLTLPDGGYVIVGEAGTGSGYAGLLIKTDARGNEEWRRTYGADRDVFIRSGTLTRDGGMVLVGSIGDREDVETWDVYLLKTGRL